MADLKKFIVFWHYNNEDLKDLLIKRAQELGYKSKDSSCSTSVTICTDDGLIWNTGYNENIEKKHQDHEIGNLKDFLTTDKYKYDPEIIIDEYKVIFKDDGIKVGCCFIGKETILKIVEKFKD